MTQPQSGSRRYVSNPLTHDYAYINAAAVGPAGVPLLAGSAPDRWEDRWQCHSTRPW